MKSTDIKVGITVMSNRNTSVYYKVVGMSGDSVEMKAANGVVKSYTLNGVAKNFTEVITIRQDPKVPDLVLNTAVYEATAQIKDTTGQISTNKCNCGCGGTTKGKKSFYMMGHDAKHKSALIELAICGNDAEKLIATTTLKSKGWYEYLEKTVTRRNAEQLRKSIRNSK